ncbi:MmgE/PrpD family protein [Bordetella genomosp. 4]|uniref:MmgE/PrpD family protein n=1 Tax=Bordetella genomosp. 4 TaxID=463044 RepID=UPI000B9E958A|nr:MmgE/PrpD family protein [Bordetella genomosp. 4]OZI49481.1 2-methylcitrate dehydratase [Bordetella genomosp. 4]
MTALETFAAFGASLRNQNLTEDVLHHAKRAVVDWYASLLPGAVLPPATLLEQAYAEDIGRGPSRLALGQPATSRAAALINGTAAHTAEVDDIFKDAIYHPGAPTIAAALAAAQETGASGRDFLRAVVVGYEISTRIGAALGRTHYKFWHNTGTVGTFGAAAAASSLYGLESRPFTHALATAATFASGLQQAFRMDSMSKPLHSGRAAEGGLAAAQMARAGVTGSLDVLDGAAGLGYAMSNGPDWQPFLATLGETFNITRMTFKNHACCGHTFSPIDAALVLKDRLQAAPDDIAQIDVHTYAPALDVAGNPEPQTAAEARFSIPFVVASAVVYGSVRLAAFDEARLKDPALRQLMSRIRLHVEPTLDGLFPGQRAARVDMRLTNGTQDSYLQPHRKGDPELPLSDADLSGKFNELVAPVLGEERAGELLRKLWSLEQAARLDLDATPR